MQGLLFSINANILGVEEIEFERADKCGGCMNRKAVPRAGQCSSSLHKSSDRKILRISSVVSFQFNCRERRRGVRSRGRGEKRRPSQARRVQKATLRAGLQSRTANFGRRTKFPHLVKGTSETGRSNDISGDFPLTLPPSLVLLLLISEHSPAITMKHQAPTPEIRGLEDAFPFLRNRLDVAGKRSRCTEQSRC